MVKVYLDHSATTPMHEEVLKAMNPYFVDRFGNPSSIYLLGQEARQAVEHARSQVADLINCPAGEIIFTAGGTEADNHALIGYALANKDKGRHIIVSSIEHHAVLETAEFLAKQGFDLTLLPVDNQGTVHPDYLKEAMRPDTILVSIMHGNNEVGTIQPIQELAEIAHQGGAVFHTDAVQTVGKIPVDVKDLNVDMLSLSGHKIYGPKGIGSLYVRKGTRVASFMHGGGQERRRRAGTENVPGIVGLGCAAEIARQEMAQEAKRLQHLAEKLIKGILQSIPDTYLTGHPHNRIPGHVSVCFKYVEGESILLMLDHMGVMASSGSACTSGSLEPSHVLLAMGYPHEIAHGSLRLTLGKSNTEEQVDYVLEVLPPIIERLRAMSPLMK
ncbi:MAG TPA: cysteine desulfurase NifS [Syntrophomonadaceae bacterium]|nr:cysteine desulfurase NifS [Syntrophomonadaceae bacterium]HPU48306.1 cysteine desulfurase NifS [Syntrophomonadaceae bacterium]